MTEIVILDAARTAIGAFGGSLAEVPATTTFKQKTDNDEYKKSND